MMSTGTVQFFRAWLRDPLRVASVTPSSTALTRKISAEISPASGPVIELGPGTGVFTRALQGRGIAPDQLTLVESGPELVPLPSARFPDLRILTMDATALRFVGLFTSTSAGAAISSLPLLSIPPRKVLAILSGTFANMRRSAAFYRITYGLRCPVPRPILDNPGLRAVRTGFTVANNPSASARSAFAPAPAGRGVIIQTALLINAWASGANAYRRRVPSRHGQCENPIEQRSRSTLTLSSGKS